MRGLTRLSLPARQLVGLVHRSPPEQRALPAVLVAMSNGGFRISQTMTAVSEGVESGWLVRQQRAGRDPDRLALSAEAMDKLATGSVPQA